MAGFKFDSSFLKGTIKKLFIEKFGNETSNAEIDDFLNSFDELDLESSSEEKDAEIYSSISDEDIIQNVIVFIYALETLHSDKIENFYDYEKSYNHLIETHSDLIKMQPNPNHYDAGYKHCLIDFKNMNIAFNKDLFTLDKIINWKYAENNEEEILTNLLNAFTIYWNNVLEGYIKSSARTKRIHYLIERLSVLKQKAFIVVFPQLTQKIATLQNEYEKLII